jgi:hypothetical protein
MVLAAVAAVAAVLMPMQKFCEQAIGGKKATYVIIVL